VQQVFNPWKGAAFALRLAGLLRAAKTNDRLAAGFLWSEPERMPSSV